MLCGHDIDIYARGRDEAPFVAEVKARKNGAGFTTLENWPRRVAANIAKLPELLKRDKEID